MLERLHDAGCQRDRAGGRILHMDRYMTLFLLQEIGRIGMFLGGFAGNGIQKSHFFSLFATIFDFFAEN